MTIDPANTDLSHLHNLLQGAVVPRPIALASTIDPSGNVNLSPFSFFNLFSSRPPILVFSPSRRGRNGSTKHTYENVLVVPEVVINIVNFKMVEQVSLSSVEFPAEVDEFRKSGLTPFPSVKIQPPRVAESPISFECKVNDVISLGTQGGAGNLVICEILVAHFDDRLFDEQGRIDPRKLDAVARMGNDFYCRASGDSLFVVPKPGTASAIGFDQVPQSIRESPILTGNDLARLGSIEELPDHNALEAHRSAVKHLIDADVHTVHRHAQQLISAGQIADAWKTLLLYHNA